MPRRFNCCIFNHPVPICCPFVNLTCTNEVVNPSFANDFGFFNNSAIGTVAPQAIIPVLLVSSEGTSIASNGAGAATLVPGSYQVSYLANGTVPASGTMSIKLELNGLQVPGSVLTATQTAGNVVNLTQSMIISITSPSTLELVNNSADNTAFAYASLSIRRI